MNHHFSYLVEDDGADFFAEYGMEKTAATVGELVGSATNGGIARAAKLPRAAEVLAPRFRRIEKMAEPAQLQAELGLLKIAGSRRGIFGMTKAATDLVAELESDPVATDQAKDAAFNVLFASSLQHDVEQLKLAMPVGIANFIGAAMLQKAAGIGSWIAKGLGKAVGHEGAELAESGIARAGAKALAHEVEPAAARGAKALGHAESGLAGKLPGTPALPGPSGSVSAIKKPSLTPRADAMRDAVDTGTNMAQEGTSVTKKIDMSTMPSAKRPVSESAPNAVAKGRVHEIENSAKQNAGAAAAAAGGTSVGAEAPKSGYVNSLNKFMRGEQLEPEERAHVFKLGLGALVADRALTHANEGDK